MKTDTKAGLIPITEIFLFAYVTLLQHCLPQGCAHSWLEFPIPPVRVSFFLSKHHKVKNTWNAEKRSKRWGQKQSSNSIMISTSLLFRENRLNNNEILMKNEILTTNEMFFVHCIGKKNVTWIKGSEEKWAISHSVVQYKGRGQLDRAYQNVIHTYTLTQKFYPSLSKRPPHDWLPKLWGPMQKENAGPLFKSDGEFQDSNSTTLKQRGPSSEHTALCGCKHCTSMKAVKAIAHV